MSHFSFLVLFVFFCIIVLGSFVCIIIVGLLRQGVPVVAQADLELVILLPQPPDCWDCTQCHQHSLLYYFLNNKIFVCVFFFYFFLQRSTELYCRY
jgi:hypothetical protein